MRKRKISFKELVINNKQEINEDPKVLERIELKTDDYFCQKAATFLSRIGNRVCPFLSLQANYLGKWLFLFIFHSCLVKNIPIRTIGANTNG